MTSVDFKGFAVFDVETTGFCPERNDRIIEIGIVRLDENLDVIERWETLVDPGRDVGPTSIHGISASDVKGAPTFSDIVGDIWHRFECAVPVAHNLVFDRRFLLAELKRTGIELASFDGICTLQLASTAGLSQGQRKLVDLCKLLGICITNAHSAGHDAWMCAELLRAIGKDTDFSKYLTPVSSPELWTRPATPLGMTRSLARAWPIESRLQEVAKRVSAVDLCVPTTNAAIDQYLLILDRVLEDRLVNDHEVDELARFATECGMSKDAVNTVHRRYLNALASQVLADGVVSEAECKDFSRVAGLLGIEHSFVEACLGGTSQRAGLRLPKDELQGKTVCFTGELRCKQNGQLIGRDQAERLAQVAGLLPMPRVTKKLDLLVVADPDSTSGKATKARDYGVRIISEIAFWQKLGLDVES